MAVVKNAGPTVGLDVGTNFIKVCEVRARGGKAEVIALGVVPTPPEAFSNGEVVDPVLLGRAIKQALAQARIKSRKVISTVSGQTGLVIRIIEVPRMKPTELKETMKWEVERHVPFAAEQVVMDFQPLAGAEEDPTSQNMEVLLAVAQESLVMRHVKALQSAGLQPQAIDIEPLASSRALIGLNNGNMPVNTVAVVDIGANSTDISIFRNGRIAFTRSIQIAGRSLTQAILEGLQLPSQDEAERLKKELGGIPGYGTASAGAVGQSADDLFADIGEDLGFGDTTLGFGAPAAATGPSATAPDAPNLDIAGGGFDASAFTDPAPATAAVPDTTLAGPMPTANPFDPPADNPFGPTPAASPFDAPPAASSPFGAPPAANPFGDPATASPFGATPAANPFDPAPAPNPFGEPPAANPFGEPPAVNPFDPGAAPTPSAFDPAPAARPTPGANPFDSADIFGPAGGGLGDDLFSSAAIAPVPVAPAAGPTGGGSQEEYLRSQITSAITPILNELATELQRSLEFFRNRNGGQGVEKVLLCGGTAKMSGLDQFLQMQLATPVAVGNPMETVVVNAKTDPSYLADVGPIFSVSLGLAVRDMIQSEVPARGKKR